MSDRELPRRNGLRQTPLRRGKGPTRAKRIKPKSDWKTEHDAVRRDDTRAMVEAKTRCARCPRRAVCFHEPLKRSRRRGSAYDPLLRVPSCGPCNTYAEENVAAATAEGWLIASTTPYAEAVKITARWLQKGAA